MSQIMMSEKITLICLYSTALANFAVICVDIITVCWDVAASISLINQ